MIMTQSEKMVADTRDVSGMTQQPQPSKVRGFSSFDLKACVHLIVVACLLTITSAEPGDTCNSETQFLVEHKNGSTSCIDCEPCPPGQTLSIKCGKRILFSAMVNCEPCKLGVSFSSKSGTSVCSPCSSCAKDQVVMQNCTLTQDIKCDKRCHGKDRYYDDDKGDCFPCAKCCQDEQDVVENECKEKLGTGSNRICSFHSSVNRCDKSTPFPQEPTTTTNQSTITNYYTSPSQDSKQETTVPATAQPRHQVLLISVILAILIPVFAVCLYFCMARQTGSYLCCNRNTETGISDRPASPTYVVHFKHAGDNIEVVEKGLVESDKVDNLRILATESMEPLLGDQDIQVDLECCYQQDSKLLTSLVNDELHLQEISACLDTTLAVGGTYRAVAQHHGFNIYQISSVLEKHDRGPTTALIEWVAATYPEQTVREFTALVRGKAKREDVARLLEAYDSS